MLFNLSSFQCFQHNYSSLGGSEDVQVLCQIGGDILDTEVLLHCHQLLGQQVPGGVEGGGQQQTLQ